MTGLSESLLHPSVGTAGIVAVMGYLVVFFGLVLLLAVVAVMGRIISRKAAQPAPAPAAEAPAPAPVVEKPAAKGTAGELKLYNVPPKDAALIMAIVAYRLGKPINELRFRSIKEVEEK